MAADAAPLAPEGEGYQVTAVSGSGAYTPGFKRP
jgi:hypothetical protein